MAAESRVAPGDKGLKQNAIGFLSSVVIGAALPSPLGLRIGTR
jgi:hypothetical protein